MARIIVITEHSEHTDAPVLLDERVRPEHLSDDHSAAQLMERLGWAVVDAENAERSSSRPRAASCSRRITAAPFAGRGPDGPRVDPVGALG